MKAMIKISIVLVLITMTLGGILLAQAESDASKPKYLVIALIKSSNDDQYVKPVQQWFLRIYTEALSRMDITLRYQVLPPKRASIYSDEGRLDGELSRVYDYNTKHPNLIRVEEHHLISVFSAFSADPTIKLNGWKSLKNTNYNVEYRRGIKKVIEELTKVVSSERLSETNSIPNGIGKLLMGRTDIYIEPEDGVFDYFNTEEFQRINRNTGVSAHKVGVMETITSHFWLHKKHRELAPQLSVILRDMKNEGLFELYLQQLELNSQLIKW